MTNKKTKQQQKQQPIQWSFASLQDDEICYGASEEQQQVQRQQQQQRQWSFASLQDDEFCGVLAKNNSKNNCNSRFLRNDRPTGLDSRSCGAS